MNLAFCGEVINSVKYYWWVKEEEDYELTIRFMKVDLDKSSWSRMIEESG